MKLRVGIDISAIPYGRGISRYTSNLVRALFAHPESVELKLFGSSMRQRDVLMQFAEKEAPGVVAKIMPHPVKIMNVLWNKFHVLSPETFMGELDIFHSWEMQPQLKKAALVSTIHDLAMLKFPKTADPYVLSMNEASWQHIKKEASAIIAVSQSTKNDAVELLQIEPERITVVHEALPQEARLTVTHERSKELLKQLGVADKPYLLFVGTTEPRKNLPRLIRAWQPLKSTYNLVIAGNAGWEMIRSEPGLIRLSSFSQEQLVALYMGAATLVYPSLYEGFGLPILEAFYHKLPVVTSNNSGMAEVAGSAAVLVDPLSEESIHHGIEQAIENKKHLVEKGQERLKQFSWEKVANETIAVYRNAVAGRAHQGVRT
jgi:glycosyltransferase involved in cell wall biosynthesis